MTKKTKKSTVEDLEKRIKQLETQVKKLKKNEKKLKNIEAKYQDIIDKMPIGYFEVDLDGNYTFFNKIIPEYHQRTPEELSGLNYQEYRSEEEAKRIYNIYEELRKTGKPVDITDNTIIQKDGSPCVISNRVFLLLNEKGEHIGYHGFTLDITDKKQSEIELQKSKDKYFEILETMEDEYYEVDLEGNIVFCNQAMCRHTGFSHEELIGMNYREYTLKEAGKTIFKKFNSVYETGKPEKISNYEVIRKDGTPRFIDLSIALRRDAQGNPIGFRGISQDVTEKRKAEKAIKESEEKYRNILEIMELGYFEMDLNGKYTYVNDAELKIHNVSREEIIGNRLNVKLSKQEEKKVYDIFKKVHSTGKPIKIANWEHYRRKDSPILVETSIALMKNEYNEAIGFYGISSDVTEKYKSEEAIRKSEKKYRNILETMEEGYFEIDLSGAFTLVNDAHCRLYGRSHEEMIGYNYRKDINDEKQNKIFEIYNNVYRTGETTRIVDWELIRRDGSVIFIEVTVSLIKDDTGEPVGFRGVARDVTERVKNEIAIRKSEKKYRNILETMEEGYFEVDLRGNYTFVNEAMCGFHGCTKDELIGLNNREYTSSEEAKRTFKAYNEVYKTGKPARITDFEIFKKDGSHVSMETSVYLLKNEQNEPIGFSGITRDVTERVVAEKALRKSEEKYRTILETMGEGYYETDLSGNFTFVNDAMCEFQGYTKDELIGMNNRTYASPEESEHIYKIYNGVYKTGKPAKIVDLEIIHKDGSVINMEASAYLMKNDKNESIGFSGITRDVTEKKRAERALRKSEEKYRTILETMEEGYYETDLKGTVTFCNPAELRIHGLEADDLIGMNNREFSSPETAKRVFKIFNEVYRTGIPAKVIDYEIIRGDGKLITLETSANLIRDEKGKPVGFKGISRDVTERIKAEKALKDSEEKYRLLVENANDGILIYQDDMILYSNKRTAEIMGYSIDELKRSSIDMYIHTDDKEKYYEKKEMKRDDNHPKIFTIRMINKTSDIFWIEFSSIPIQWEEKPAELIFLSDITQQKKMEVQLLQAQKMEALGTLAGGIAHDFNNLLMGIQGNASLVQLVLGEKHPQIEKLKSIERLVTDGSELTKQLLGVARGGKYEAVPADMNMIIEKSTDLFGRTKKEISIHKILNKDLWVAEVDRGQIEQVLLNLYVNAWHAMPNGGDLYVETKNVALDEYYTKSFGIEPGKYIRISVTDNGVGMDEETRKKVFDPFFTTKEMGRGTGLGLASAYGIIRNHKGFINVYSEIEQGTTFNIYLPVSTKKIKEEKHAEEEIITGNETILFVDDEDAIIEVGQQLLEALGYKVFLTKSGEETIDIYKKEMNNIDLIILDMIMPGMSGGDTYDELLKINQNVKVLLASGYSLNGQAEKILEKGCEGFIQKPFNLEELSKKIREVLDSNNEKKVHTNG